MPVCTDIPQYHEKDTFPATVWIVYFPATILSTFEYCGNGMEKAQERMEQSGGLTGKGLALLCC
jgi:hypothetical protein